MILLLQEKNLLDNCKKGKYYTELIPLLRDRITNNTENFELREAFSCILAGRAISLLFSLYEWEDYGKSSLIAFQKKKQEWIQAQLNPNHNLYGAEPLLDPFPIRTRDDNQSINAVSAKDTIEYAYKLIKESDDSLNYLVDNSKSNNQKAYYRWVRGWCHLITYRVESLFKYAINKKDYIKSRHNVLTLKVNESVQQDFEYCMDIDPNNAAYCAAMGDCLVPRGFISMTNDFEISSNSLTRIISLFENSYKINSKNRDILFWVFCLKYIMGDIDFSLLKNLCRYYRDNSIFYYLYSASLYKENQKEIQDSSFFKNKKFKELISYIDQGNHIGLINIPVRKFILPPYLSGITTILDVIQENWTSLSSIYTPILKIKELSTPSDEEMVRFWIPMLETIYDYPLIRYGYFAHKCSFEISCGVLSKIELDKLKNKGYSSDLFLQQERRFYEIDKKQAVYSLLLWKQDQSRP